MSQTSAPVTRETLDRKVLELLVCPMTKTELVLSDDGSELISRAARLAYPIRKGVPLMCLSESRTLAEDELEQLR